MATPNQAPSTLNQPHENQIDNLCSYGIELRRRRIEPLHLRRHQICLANIKPKFLRSPGSPDVPLHECLDRCAIPRLFF
jgi:hypothetical protein